MVSSTKSVIRSSLTLVFAFLVLLSSFATINALSFTGYSKTLPKIYSRQSSTGTITTTFSTYRITTTTTTTGRRSRRRNNNNKLMMISTGDDRSERQSLDISKTTYISLVKSPKDAYQAVRIQFRILLDGSLESSCCVLGKKGSHCERKKKALLHSFVAIVSLTLFYTILLYPQLGPTSSIFVTKS
jgi:hypothetical protein